MLLLRPHKLGWLETLPRKMTSSFSLSVHPEGVSENVPAQASYLLRLVTYPKAEMGHPERKISFSPPLPHNCDVDVYLKNSLNILFLQGCYS